MYLKSLELSGFKSFAKKTELHFDTPVTAIVGPNGSGKSNVAEAFRFVLGEQSIKALRGKRGEDLIFNGSKTMSRQNRAFVKVVLDNSKRLLNIDFDEVVIERVVHRDNNNEYLLNGSNVRLKDIMELLAGANMGPSGHHIISQGEADRILSADIRERRIMLEDALGLKIFQYKRQESERKLERTKENISQVESLRREIAPHLKFLRKQVEKVEKMKDLKQELTSLYKEYLGKENSYLEKERGRIAEGRKGPTAELKELDKEIDRARRDLEKAVASDGKSKEVLEIESMLALARNQKEALSRTIGKIEGELSSETRRKGKLLEIAEKIENRTVPFRDVRILVGVLEKALQDAVAGRDFDSVKNLIQTALRTISDFVKQFESKEDRSLIDEVDLVIRRLEDDRKEAARKLEEAERNVREAEERYRALSAAIEEDKTIGRTAEKEIFRIMSRQNELHSALNLLKNSEDRLKIEEAEYERELNEAVVLAGPDAIRFEAFESAEADERFVQIERHRHLEKVKIRIEEMGGVGTDVMKEFDDVSNRDQFLAKEIEDLEKSALSLEGLIKELVQRLDIEFRDGVDKVNRQFDEYFGLMFGGGHAELKIVKEKRHRRRVEEEMGLSDISVIGEPEEEKEEEGIEIGVNLPHKRIKSLEMLSGGERALTSIALLFAISQVKPPPFIILDETDAALDEANSRKYGNMIENLSKYSQLVLITHNRETMSRAGVLYGITMGQDGMSKLLSIQFDEAVAVAK